MKHFFTTLFVLTIVCLPFSKISAQCSGTACNTPTVAFDAPSACILPSANALSCYFGETVSSAPVSLPPFWCTSVENNQWFAFTATSANVALEIEALNCASGGAIQAALLQTGDCVNFDFVSECLGNIESGTTQILSNNVPLVPGNVYYLMIDGSAGAVCNYAINGASSITMGPQMVCIPSLVPSTYQTTNPADWTIQPAGAGTFVGSSTGTNSVQVDWQDAGMFQICAQNTNCPNIPPFCLDVTVGRSEEATYNVNLCTGESVYCGGNTYSSPGSFVSNVPAPSGCDSVITCIITQIPPISSPVQIVNLCGPTEFQLCSDYWTYSGFYSSTCESWQGCDSVASVNLNILEPLAYISPPAELGCGVDSIQFLDGSGSGLAFPPNTWTMQWTGPGIVGPTNGILIQVNEPGEYCLTVTHKTPSGTFSCENMTCVNVTETIELPSAPQVTGPTPVCSNSMSTYTANLQGTIIPTNLTWTTPNGEPFTTGANNTAIVNWAGSSGGLLCVTANNECGSSPPACINVVVNAAPAVPVVTGPATVCASGTTQTYSIASPLPNTTYNWVVPTGATFTGSGSSINVNFSGVANGNVQVCATATNNCGTSQPGCANVIVTGPPVTPTMSGPTSVCANGTPPTFTVTNIQAGITYTWSVPTGAVMTGSGTSITVDFTNSNSGQVCVTATNGCGNPVTCQTVTVIAPPTASLSGAGEYCQGTTPSINLTLDLTGGTPPWTVVYINGGTPVTLTVPATPFTFPVSSAGTYTLVSVVGSSQCTGTVSGSAVVTENPSPTATLSGGGDICEGSGQTIPLSITLTGEAPWSVAWSVDGVAQSPLAISASPFALPIGESLAGAITLGNVTDNNGCAGTGTGTAQVEVFGAPTVNDVATLCNAANTHYTVSFTITGGDPGSYSVTPSGTLTGGQFTSDPIPNGAGYSFIVTDANDCDPITVEDPVVVCDCDTEVGVMDPALIEICGPNSTTALYDNTNEFLDGNDAMVFILHSGNSVSIVPPIITTSTTPDVTFDPGTMSFGTTYYLSAVVGDDDGTGDVLLTDPCLQVAQGTPIIFYNVPTADISGGGEICIGSSLDLMLELTGVAPWEVIINSQSLAVFQSPFTYTVTPTTTTVYTVTSIEGQNCMNTVDDSETVTVNEPPTVSNIQTECDPTGTTFTVCFDIMGGDPSCYMVTPLNGTITGNTFCSNPIAEGMGYDFSVSDCNGCTPFIVHKDLVDCDCLSEAGDLDPTPLHICGSDIAAPSYDDTDEFLDADDALCFVLHAGNPTQPLATNSTASFSFQTGMSYGQTYFICPVVANEEVGGCVDFGDPCLNIGGCTEVVFHEIPTATIGPDASICAGDATTLTFNVTGAAPWTVGYTDAEGAPQTMTLTTSPVNFDVSPTATGNYTLTSVSDQFCDGTVSGTAIVTVNEAPQVENIVQTCSADAISYVVTFDIVGGQAGTYTVTPAAGFLNNGTFTSQSIASNTPWSFDVDDINGCGPITISGNKICDCDTDAGTMSTNLVAVCEGDPANVAATLNPVLDGDDVLVYYLHTGSGPSLGTVITTTTTSPPSFDFDPALMTYGTTYYVSPVVGNNNGTGGVDLTDPCLDIAAGTPVVFHELPTAAISGTAAICQGMSTPVVFTATGEGPFTITYSVDGGAPQVAPVPAAGTATVDVSPIATQEITLISVTDANCSNVATSTVTITVNPNVDAGTPNGNFEFCKGENEIIDLNTKLTGATAGGTWIGPNGEIIPGGSFNVAGLNFGTFDFTYSVPGLPPCPDDEAIVKVVINPLPTADAGTPTLLTCDVTEAVLGGPGTTPGVTYAWSNDSLSLPAVANPIITEPGIYLLTVTTPAGCTGTDQIEIEENVSTPVADVTVSGVSCFGDHDGFITVNEISNGTPPYLVSFNGGAFTNQMSINNLSPGDHTVAIQDASGCEATLNFMVNEPQQVTVEIEGNFEGGDPIVSLGDPIVLTIATNPPVEEMDNIYWSPADLIECDSCGTNTIYPTQQTTFKVIVEENGCSDEDILTVFVRKDHPLYVPNAFSPNGDLINDFLVVYGGKQVKVIKSFLVFSRWGEAVFKYYNFLPNDPAWGWNGKHRDEIMNPAVFTWYAEVEFIDGKVEIFEGDVNLTK